MEYKTKKKNEKTKIDDRTLSKNENLVIKIEPLDYTINKIIKTIKNYETKTIFLSPQGKKLNQNDVKNLSKEKEIIIICGRNKGLDERIIKKFIDNEFSVGDYIVNNGDIATLILINAVNRFKNKIKKLIALDQNTFKNKMFDYPSYTKPKIFKQLGIPKILTYGNHNEIDKWKTLYSKKKLGYTDLI